MAVHDLTSQRLFVDDDFSQGAEIALRDDQAHYLVNVMRAKAGVTLLVFNGRDGEWSATISEIKKRSAVLRITDRVRPQLDGPDVVYAFAPLKRARLDYMVQKATEMGVAVLQPVLTQHTVAERVNLERMRANAVEAAEQCGVLRVPAVREPVSFARLLADWEPSRTLIFCDEGQAAGSPLAAMAGVDRGPLGVLIGPEGGFSEPERQALLSKPYVRVLWLGPRIMRADTAAVAALALINATLGDWR